MPHLLLAGDDVGFESFSCFKGPSSADWEITYARKSISEGIVVVTYGVPPEGINLLYKCK